MTRRLAVFVPLFASLALLAACGSSPSTGNDGGGTLADGRSAADGGAADAGRPDAGRVDGGRQDAGTTADAGTQCLESGCVDATGNYNTCLTCWSLSMACPLSCGITNPPPANLKGPQQRGNVLQRARGESSPVRGALNHHVMIPNCLDLRSKVQGFQIGCWCGSERA